jgi:Glycosyl hydrolase family 99
MISSVRSRRARATRAMAALVVAAVAAAVPSGAAAAPVRAVSAARAPSASAGAASQDDTVAVPLLAFYYLWFDAASWDRAKSDLPRLGRYTSDDPQVMRQHIRWAKSAGIDGFIVSWKDTPTNDRRLQLLMGVARQEDFKLAMIYQGLDFGRKPLPVATVAADLAYFRDTFAQDPVFLRMGGKPLTVWSGTWAFSHADVARVTGPVRDTLLVLNTEKSVEGYRRIADVTDGDAYYWSSANPLTNDSYSGKLTAMSQAIHSRGQFWVAPFAPGFDARLVGGERIVDRQDGKTLRTEYSAAVRSSPDALGLISWNEFSENSYVEPSQKYGDASLTVLRSLRQAATPVPVAAADSSDSAAGLVGTALPADFWPNVVMLGGFVVVLLLGGAFARWALRRRGSTAPGAAPHGRRRAPDPSQPRPEPQDVHVRW